MNWFAGRKRDKAVARYARTLPGRLARDYGASSCYTRGQIDKAIAALKLDPEFAAYGHAMFLPETDYDAITPSYAEARAAFIRKMPGQAVEGAFYESGIGPSAGSIGIDGG